MILSQCFDSSGANTLPASFKISLVFAAFTAKNGRETLFKIAPLNSNASMVFLKVGVSALLMIASISASCSLIP